MSKREERGSVSSVSFQPEDFLTRLKSCPVPEGVQKYFDRMARDRGIPPLVIYMDSEEPQYVGLSRAVEEARAGTWVVTLPTVDANTINDRGTWEEDE